MKIALAADHAGFAFKEKLAAELLRLGHEPIDFGTLSSESCDYPDFAIPAAQSVSDGKAQRGILLCTNGIGMCMVANRVPHVRGALVYSARTAEMTRRHHDSNVLCLGAGEFPAETLLEWVRRWLETPFEGGRHERRIGKLEALERK
ncbi:MAG: RpiB/LacA/LacB family sugar-phosphate isomerase [Myxococcota bacterium]